MTNIDCAVVGASFAGLACSTALARAGMRVTVFEKKADAGERLHTTGILVKDVVDRVALLDGTPAELVRRVNGVRLYAPSLRSVDLVAPDYYFLATDTPALMRWLAARAEEAGARIAWGTPFLTATRTRSGFDLDGMGTTRYLVGADGPHSRVAKCLGLGRNDQFLFGVEYEYAGVEIDEPDRLHCFIDRRLAPGYIGWVLAGVGAVQVGFARRIRSGRFPATEAMNAFLRKIAPIFDFRGMEPSSVRAGAIPCGGVVNPIAERRVMLVGDAAGMVSPVTAGGIHNALKHGLAAGHAIGDYLSGRGEDPAHWFARSCPRYRTRLALRFLYDRFQSDALFDLLLGTRLMRTLASSMFFHYRGASDPAPLITPALSPAPRAAPAAVRNP